MMQNGSQKLTKILCGMVLILSGWVTFSLADVTNISVTVNKPGAEFYTMKPTQPGDVSVHIENNRGANGGGWSDGFSASLHLIAAGAACNGSASALSNDLSITDLTLANGETDYDLPPFRFLMARPGGQASTKFRLAVSSNTTSYACSGAINIYDFISMNAQLVKNINPHTFSVGFDIDDSSDLVVNVISSSTHRGLEQGMRITAQVLDLGSNVRGNWASGTGALTPGSTFYYPSVTPYYASGAASTLRFFVTVSSNNGTVGFPGSTLYPKTGSATSITGYFLTTAGTPTKLLLLPGNTNAHIQPDPIGRPDYGFASPYVWIPDTPGSSLGVTAMLTDAWSNPVGAQSLAVTFELADPLINADYLVLPPCSALSSCDLGTTDDGIVFPFNLTVWQVPIPIRITGGIYASDTIYITKEGLPKDKIFAGPSPFNPKRGGTIGFAFQVDSDTDVTIRVRDLFGQQVWSRTVSAAADEMNTDVSWDGKNDKGEVVAAGVYFAILEKDGDVKSKVKIGVVK